MLNKKQLVTKNIKSVHGIGDHHSKFILNLLGLSTNLKNKEFTPYYAGLIKNLFEQLFIVFNRLKYFILLQCRNYTSVMNHRGRRYARGLPVRGQRTKTNANNSKLNVIKIRYDQSQQSKS